MSTLNKHWNIRIDHIDPSSKTLMKSFLTKLIPKSLKIVSSEEIATETGKHHYHSYVHLTEPVTKYAMDKRVLRHFPFNKGSTKGVAQVKKLATNLIYICKDGKPFLLHNVTEAEFMQYKKEWKPKKKPKNVVIEIAKKCKQPCSPSEIFNKTFEYYQGKPMDYNRMKSVMYGVIGYKNPLKGKQMFINYLNKDFDENIFYGLYINKECPQEGAEENDTDDDENERVSNTPQ